MLRTHLLIKIFIAAILSVAVLLVYLSMVVHPAYRDLLIENAEDEAVRFVSFLVASQKIDTPINRINLPPGIEEEIRRLHGDEMLIKLRIFSPQGEIVYSTLPKEIGTVNKHSYFKEFVASGKVYSKTVQKDALTAEMEIVNTDLVETYVPIMAEGTFIGAFEIYYDITSSTKEIASLTQHSLALLGSLSLILLSFLYYALHHADLSILARKKAEKALRHINEDLEMLVEERAGELLEANTKLTREITERTLAQMALSEALSEMNNDKEKMASILKSVNDGLLVVDSANRIVMMNAAAESILSVTQNEAVDLPLSQAIKDAYLYTELSGLLTGKKLPYFDFESTVAESGQKQIYQARTSQLRAEDDTVYGTIILMQNVTQERQLEQMKADFLAMAAHELSTPLATIIGYADLLTDKEAPALSPDIQQQSLNYIHDKANALSRIIDDLLDISRAESGQNLSIIKVTFDLNQTLSSLVVHYNEINNDHSILFKQTEPDGEVSADPIRIGQALDNLMSNAIKYTPTGGQIQVSNRRVGDYFQIEISDNGAGMTPDQLERIFDKFYRADASNTAKPGIGLGMSITKHIIEGHGGTIAVSSEPGRGTRVLFTLPRLCS